jgi:osmotically-inducible protein OsmY
MSAEEIARHVTEELVWDPRIDSQELAIAADDQGVVTLRGTVGSFREKREAREAAKRVYGVTRLDDQLEVRLLDDAGRDDAELRGAVLQSLMLDAFVPATIDARVYDGWVILIGTATWQYERDEAELQVGNTFGVVGVTDDVTLVAPKPMAQEVARSIESAFRRDARLDADSVTVGSSNGTISLSGAVSSWSEHDAAVAAAWAAPGVTAVEDMLVVDY